MLNHRRRSCSCIPMLLLQSAVMHNIVVVEVSAVVVEDSARFRLCTASNVQANRRVFLHRPSSLLTRKFPKVSIYARFRPGSCFSVEDISNSRLGCITGDHATENMVLKSAYYSSVLTSLHVFFGELDRGYLMRLTCIAMYAKRESYCI